MGKIKTARVFGSFTKIQWWNAWHVRQVLEFVCKMYSIDSEGKCGRDHSFFMSFLSFSLIHRSLSDNVYRSASLFDAFRGRILDHEGELQEADKVERGSEKNNYVGLQPDMDVPKPPPKCKEIYSARRITIKSKQHILHMEPADQ